MNFSYSISYESDTRPVETVSGTFEAKSAKSASVKAGRAVRDNWPKGRRFRSWVICIENLSTEGDADGE